MTAEEARQKLDYEQQCYRASERIVRARLEELQDSVRELIKNRKARAAETGSQFHAPPVVLDCVHIAFPQCSRTR